MTKNRTWMRPSKMLAGTRRKNGRSRRVTATRPQNKRRVEFRSHQLRPRYSTANLFVSRMSFASLGIFIIFLWIGPRRSHRKGFSQPFPDEGQPGCEDDRDVRVLGCLTSGRLHHEGLEPQDRLLHGGDLAPHLVVTRSCDTPIVLELHMAWCPPQRRRGCRPTRTFGFVDRHWQALSVLGKLVASRDQG